MAVGNNPQFPARNVQSGQPVHKATSSPYVAQPAQGAAQPPVTPPALLHTDNPLLYYEADDPT